MEHIYSADYYSGHGCDPLFEGASDSKRQDAKLLLRSIKDYLNRDSFFMIEAGGGAGLLSELACEHGIEALMIDLSAASVDIARSKGIDCYRGEITDEHLKNHHGKVDVVVALEVLEHVYSPMKFLQAVFELLRPGGLFVFTTGNVSETRIYGARWGYMSIPEAHVYYFSTRTLRRYLSRVGFSRRVDAYKYYAKRNIAVRLLEGIGLIDTSVRIRPVGLIERAAYSLFKGVETVSGRRRFDWAVK